MPKAQAEDSRAPMELKMTGREGVWQDRHCMSPWETVVSSNPEGIKLYRLSDLFSCGVEGALKRRERDSTHLLNWNHSEREGRCCLFAVWIITRAVSNSKP